MDLDLGEGTQLVVWLGWEHNPLVQLGWMREHLKLSKCMHLIYYVQSVARQQNRFEGSSGGSEVHRHTFMWCF